MLNDDTPTGYYWARFAGWWDVIWVWTDASGRKWVTMIGQDKRYRPDELEELHRIYPLPDPPSVG